MAGGERGGHVRVRAGARLMHRVRVGMPGDTGEAARLKTWCARNGVEILPDGEGSAWLVGHAIRVTAAVRSFFRDRLEEVADGLERVPEQGVAFAPPPTPAGTVARLREVVAREEAWGLAEAVHAAVAAEPECGATYLQVQCLGHPGPWAASFDPSTVGCDDPWFEEDFIAGHTLVAVAPTMAEAVWTAASLTMAMLKAAGARPVGKGN
jgi:hypothetical protein